MSKETFDEIQKRMALEALDRVRALVEAGADTISSSLSFQHERVDIESLSDQKPDDIEPQPPTYFEFTMNGRCAS